MTHQELWLAFCKENNIPSDTKYEAWQFGGAPNELAELVKNGIKTATCSAYDLYIYDKEEFPKVGDYSVILNGNDEAICIIKTTKLYKEVFRNVSESHAYKEGERDRSLSAWKDIHIEFFTNEYKDYPIEFTMDSNVLCEEFEVVYIGK